MHKTLKLYLLIICRTTIQNARCDIYHVFQKRPFSVMKCLGKNNKNTYLKQDFFFK